MIIKSVFSIRINKITIYFLTIASIFIVSSILAEPIDFGPFYYQGIDVYGRTHLTAIGPVVEKREDTSTNKFFAIRPLYSIVSSAKEDRAEKNVLWPIWICSSDKINYEWKLMYLMFWKDFDKNDENSKYRFWLLPLYFQGRNDEKKNYIALFPVLGKIYDFLGQDEIAFFLFPLYSRWRVNDVETYNLIWPIFSHTEGEGIKRHRFFPFYGYSRLRDDYEKYFVLWPIWSYATYRYPDSSGYGYIFFPVFGRTRIETENTFFILPPFFRYTSGTKQNVVNTPWPILQFGSGRTQRKYLWPIIGERKRNNDSYFFLFWPFYNSWKTSNDFCVTERRMFIPFYYSQRADYTSTNALKGYTITNTASFKLWPIISWKKEDEKERIRIFSLFPFRDFEAIEKNYDPLWTIYSSEKNKNTIEHNLLWGLMRWRYNKDFGTRYFSLFPIFNIWKDNEDNYSWSFLKGLFGREYKEKKAIIKLLYFFSF